MIRYQSGAGRALGLVVEPRPVASIPHVVKPLAEAAAAVGTVILPVTKRRLPNNSPGGKCFFSVDGPTVCGLSWSPTSFQ